LSALRETTEGEGRRYRISKRSNGVNEVSEVNGGLA
jgi:hypothetical protein